MKPRYIGDVQTPHLATPRRAKECFLMSKQIVTTQRKTIAQLLRDLRTARAKIKKLGELILHLRKNHLLSVDSAKILTVRSVTHLRYLDKLFNNLLFVTY